MQESLTQKAQSTSAMLGSFRPLNTVKPRGPTHKPPPSVKDSTGAGIPPATGKQSGAAIVKKAPPPMLGEQSASRNQASSPETTNWPSNGTMCWHNNNAVSRSIASTNISQTILHIPRRMARLLALGEDHHQPSFRRLLISQGRHQLLRRKLQKVLASIATADLEEILRKKREAKRTRPDEQADVQPDDRGQPKQQRSRHRKHEHRSGRDTRRRNRSPSEHSSSSDTSDEDRRSPSSRGCKGICLGHWDMCSMQSSDHWCCL